MSKDCFQIVGTYLNQEYSVLGKDHGGAGNTCRTFGYTCVSTIFVTFQLLPPNENYSPLQHRLFVNFHGEEFNGRDVVFLEAAVPPEPRSTRICSQFNDFNVLMLRMLWWSRVRVKTGVCQHSVCKFLDSERSLVEYMVAKTVNWLKGNFKPSSKEKNPKSRVLHLPLPAVLSSFVIG